MNSSTGSILIAGIFNNATNVSGNTTRQFCEEIDDSAPNILYSVCMSLVMVLSLCGNTLVVASVLMSRVLRKRVSSMFVASLACSDFYFAFSLIPIKISTALNGSRFCHSLSVCYWFQMSDSLANTASILNLLVIALDRFIAIKTPYIYTEKVTKHRAAILIVLIWSLALCCSVIGIFKWENSANGSSIFSIYIGRMCLNKNKYFYLIVNTVIYVTSLFIMSCIYATILHVALSHIKAIESTTTNLKKNNLLKYQQNGSERSIKAKGQSNRRRKRELKTTKSLALVYCAFVICWLPACIINVTIFVNGTVFKQFRKSHTWWFEFVYYVFIEILPSINTAVNPFIYSFSNTQFRTAFKNVYLKLVGNHLKFESDFDSSLNRSPKSSSVSGIITRLTPNTILKRLKKSTTLQEINDGEIVLMKTRGGTL